MRLCLLPSLLAIACGENAVPSGPGRVEVALVPTVALDGVDLLFVVQDSCCVLDKQIALRAALSPFLAELSRRSGELPSVHIGSVSTDLGTSSDSDPSPGPAIGSGPGSCAGTGRAAVMRTNGSPFISGTFVSDIANGDLPRARNYTGTLADAVSAMLSIGAGGCAFEQPLRAARLALENPANAGFKRGGSALAIILLAEDEDCSATSTELFSTDTSVLGTFSTFRCYRYGVTCDIGGATPDEMNAPGEKSACHPNETSPYVLQLGSYAASIESFAGDPRNVLFAAIAGDKAPVTVEPRTQTGGGETRSEIASVCSHTGENEFVSAQPGVRIGAATEAFRRHVLASSCADNYEEPMVAIARQIRSMIGDPCLATDIHVPADCEVADELVDGTRIVIPACTSAVTEGCYTLVEDATCTTTQQLRVEVTRTGEPSPGAMVSVRCRL
jgi:hypothetical protein